jgi:GNAT superfamily N-acetyltransferase
MTTATDAASEPGTDGGFELREVHLSDPLVRPLLSELAVEYGSRYPELHRTGVSELDRYPAEEFAPPRGALLLLLADGEPVAGGAYRRYDRRTAELKRIWTHSAHRRRGLARRIVSALETSATRRGYARVYLTTGPRQPEARALYLAAGYSALFDLTADPETIGSLPFAKSLNGGPPPAPYEFPPKPRRRPSPAPSSLPSSLPSSSEG